MTDPIMAELFRQDMPSMNKNIMEGLVMSWGDQQCAYLEQVWRGAIKSYPPGFEFVGIEQCTPDEEFAHASRVSNNRRSLDLARSDTTLFKTKLRYKKVPIPDRYLYLLHFYRGGLYHISGTEYHAPPVLTDKVISPGLDSVFVKLLRDKLIIRRTLHNIVVDGVRENLTVVWSQIYRKANDNSKVEATSRAETILAHYLFCKFGFYGAFEKYAGVRPIIGLEEINQTNYPPETYTIFASCETKPTTCLTNFYEPVKYRIAIEKSKISALTTGLVVGFFYILDHFPNMMPLGSLGRTDMWRIMLGNILFSGNYGAAKLLTRVNEHFGALDEYMDAIAVEKLSEINYDVKNFYDLLSELIKKFSLLLVSNRDDTLSMYSKSIEVLYYLLYDITSAIFRVSHALCKIAARREITERDITETFSKYMKPGMILKLSNGKVCSEPVATSTPLLYPKITALCAEQESLPGATRGKSRRGSVSPKNHIHVSMATCGSPLFLAKTNPTPKRHLNPYVMIDMRTGTMLPHPEFAELEAKTAAMLSGKVEFLDMSDLLDNQDEDIAKD